MSLTIDYLKYHCEYSTKYGDKTLVLMQVGSFFECYSTNEKGPELQSISYLLNIILTKKDKSILETSEKNPKMLGFPCVSLQKNLKIRTNRPRAGYICPLRSCASREPQPESRPRAPGQWFQS